MIKKMKITYALIAILIVALVITNVYFYLENTNLSSLVKQNQLKQMYKAAEDVWSHLGSFEAWYDDSMWRLHYYVEGSFSNQTKDSLIWTTGYLLDRYSDRISYDIKGDLSTLKWLDETSLQIYENISNTVEYALAQVEWAMLGRGDLNESYTLLWELYHILGVDQITRIENLSRLRGIERSFNFLSNYWRSEYYFIRTNGRDKIPSYYPKPEVALEWALGNATALYPELTEWHERTKPY